MDRFLLPITTCHLNSATSRLVPSLNTPPPHTLPTINMCIDIIYKYACGCRVSPVGAPHRQMCFIAANTGRECWVATEQKHELWHGKDLCPVHKGKKSKAQQQKENARLKEKLEGMAADKEMA